MIDIRKKQIFEWKAFVDAHRSKFPPLNRNSPLSVITGSSLEQQAEMTEEEKMEELFRYQLGDIEREIIASVSALNKITHEYKLRGSTEGKTLLEEFLNPLELGEIDHCVKTNKSVLNAVKMVKDFTRLGLKEAKDLFDAYYKVRFRGIANGEKFNF